MSEPSLHLHLSETLREDMIQKRAVMLPRPVKLLAMADALNVYRPDVNHASLYVPGQDKKPEPVFEDELIVPVSALTTREIARGLIYALNTPRREKIEKVATGVAIVSFVFGLAIMHGTESDAGMGIGVGGLGVTGASLLAREIWPMPYYPTDRAHAPVIVERMTPLEEQ